MRNERLAAAHQVADRLFEAEAALDIAIARTAELAAAIPNARRDANLAACVGQEAFMCAANMMPMLAEAREQLITAHERLDETKTQIGLRQTAFGSSGGKPPSGEGELHIIGKAA